MTRSHRPVRGFVLLVVLWSLALMALVGSQIMVSARQESVVAESARVSAVLDAAANGAIQRVIFGRLDPAVNRWLADGMPRTIQIGRVPVIVRVTDEADKVNLNLASVPLLRALLVELGADPGTAAAVTAAIVEWRETGAPAGGGRYAAAGRPYAPPGAPFVNLDELGAVLGMTPSLLARLRPHVTVLSDRDPDATTNDPIVARALMAAGEGGGPTAEREASLISISVDARGPGHSHRAMRVVLETNTQARGRRYRILSSERLWEDQ